MSGRKLHADDTPVPVLAPGAGKTNWGACGRICGMIARLASGGPAVGLTRRIAEANIRIGI